MQMRLRYFAGLLLNYTALISMCLNILCVLKDVNIFLHIISDDEIDYSLHRA